MGPSLKCFPKILVVVLVLFCILPAGRAELLEKLPTSGEQIRIGIFAGTFDPPTVGHLELTIAGLAHGLDYVVVVPNNQTAHKPNATPYDIRRELTEVAYKNESRVFVPSAKLAATDMTIAAIQFLKARIPNAVVVSMIGSDVADLMSGRTPGYRPEQNSGWTSLVDEWMVVRRGEVTPPPSLIFSRKVVVIDDVAGATSSTAVRSSVARGEDNWNYKVPRAVAEKIRQYRLYVVRCENVLLEK